MTQSKTAKTLHVAIAIAVITCMGIGQADAAPPNAINANIDFEASGFVAPAGMVPPSMYQGGVMSAGYQSPMAAGYQTGVTPVGFFGSGAPCGCDASSGCDGGCGGCDSSCGTGCGGGCCGGGCCSMLGSGGLLGELRGEGTACGGCGAQGCDSCGGMSNLRNFCIFCRGSGCGVCQLFCQGRMMCDPRCLLPYAEQGICAQRWYDISAEAMFLSHSNGGLTGPVTTFGQAPGLPGDPVPPGIVALTLGDADGGGDLEAGARLSAAFIWGPGGNIEFTYVGGQQWNSVASVSDPTASLFSFVSDFGRLPPGGFDDTDRSIFQSVANSSEFHSGELNYRRRTVGPYCRFQGSWLVGLRYVNYQDGLLFSALGEMDNTVNANLPRFFSSNDQLKNNLFGPQAGFDFWWNVVPGVNLGVGCKGAWVQNDIDRRTTLTANSISPGGSPGIQTVEDGMQDTTVMGEFEAKLIYRVSHSWALRTSYYALAIDDIAFGSTDQTTIDDFVTANPLTSPSPVFHSLVLQGFSVGAEYTW